jgi:regulator of replication initiation timing
MLATVGAYTAAYIVATVVAVVTALGGAIAVLRSQAMRTSVSLLREENADLRNALESLRQRLADAEKKIAELTASNRALTEAVTQAAAVKKLTELVEGHFRRVHQEIAEIRDAKRQ